MARYLLKRILLFIPTLIIISLLAFVISVNAPGDPVSRMMSSAESGDVFQSQNAVQLQQQKLWSHRLGLDLPVFYFSIAPGSFPDTLYKIYDRQERDALKSLLYQFGNWNSIDAYHSSLKKIFLDLDWIKLDSTDQKKFSANEINEVISQARFNTLALLTTSQISVISIKLDEMHSLFFNYPFFNFMLNDDRETQKTFDEMKTTSERWKNYFPTLHFYSNNQYHRWLFGDGVYSKGLICGDLGISFVSQMPVLTIIWQHIGWSLLFTFISVILAYLISLPVGIRAAVKHGSAFDSCSSVILFLLHSMPSFWVATFLLIIFANPDVLYWFPASGVKPVSGYPADASFIEKVKLSLPYLILPTIAYTYSSLAFLSRLTRASMLEIIQQDYVRTARAKGLSERVVVYKHAFRNALLPIITVFANILPAALGGSVILESIFSIPGMGRETFHAIQNQDYPMIVGVFTLTGVLTLIGYLVADVLYAAVDPRISFSPQGVLWTKK
ncbi:MAG TPA: ABC transporter permease [Chitinophagales bacterium]|nr:ABC transporter permease [Chitinophagales bacterium]